ncbi:hypothetical protein [uncultured Propionivibrio sp.]|uniref:hypothetical protein n=1 Tax=uncultured Propionivibrio sp. TaxID=426737 RepID=UPI0029BFC6B7|nr:hypothetical protein [uncultured Propionivibrio sp.]
MTVSQEADPLDRRILVTGDVNTGKTTQCRRWLEALCRQGLGHRIALLDLAPTIPPDLARARGMRGVGGELRPPPECGVLDLRALLVPPRLSSTSDAEALAKARDNAEVIDALIARLRPERDILFINDVTLFLQARTATRLIDTADFGSRTTIIVNGYRGERLGGGELTRHEAAEMAELVRLFSATGEVLHFTQRYDVSH